MGGGPGYGGDVAVDRIGIGVTRFLEIRREKEKRPKGKGVAGFYSGGKKFKIALWRQEDKQWEKGVEVIEKVRAFKEISGEEEAEEVELNSLVEDAIQKHEEIFSREEIELKCSKEEVKVMGGPLLEELFSNLLENTVRHANCDNVRIDTEERNQEIVVTVEDDGKGSPDEDKEKIFERGFKSGETGGSGLGLYLVKRIAETYGGSIEVKDSELGGARFDVYLKKA